MAESAPSSTSASAGADGLLRDADPEHGAQRGGARREQGRSPDATERTFGELDALAEDPSSSGLYVICGDDAPLEALRSHIERRLQAVGRFVIAESAARTDEPWRGIAERLGVVGSDPLETGRSIFFAMCSAPPSKVRAPSGSEVGSGALVVLERAATSWGSAVRGEIERLLASGASVPSEAPLFVVLSTDAERSGRSGSAAPFRGILSKEGIRGWWEAVAADPASIPSLDRLERLERWWSAARATPLDACPEPPSLGDEALLLLSKLTLAQRPWPVAEIDRLGAPAVFQDLLAKGVVEIERAPRAVMHADPAHRGAAPVPGRPSGAADMVRRVRVSRAGLELALPLHRVRPRERLHLGHALELIAPTDAWASMRAAELFVSVDEIELAEVSATRALSGVTEATAREDFWRRWHGCLAGLPDSIRRTRLRRAAEVALRVGDVDRALSLARSAVSGESVTRDDPADVARGEAFEAHLVLGRATSARGDLTAASITLGKAMALATDPGARARAEVEIAEVSYASGHLERAREHASSALAAAPDLATRLLARNVLGKLLLARGAWEEAELHFAADGSDAECGGDTVGELRARLNRGIALFSSGRLEEARAMLRSVLADGERTGELRATSFALSNLAAIAIVKHEYVEALALSERAIDVSRRIGEKIGLARLITNLAELRLRLGLVSEAEQALAFGRRACGSDIPGARLTHFSLVAARIHLMRGQTKSANVEMNEALLGASRSTDGGRLAECHRLAARIALEDGDLKRAQASIDASLAAASTPRARAESLVLDASRARAAGEPFEASAHDALELARAADDDELMREAHLLLFQADDDLASDEAGEHLEAALALRDRVATSLPEPLRSTFLDRRDLRLLTQLEARRLAERSEGHGTDRRPASQRSAPHSTPRSGFVAASLSGTGVSAKGARRTNRRAALERMVGRHPAMLALASAIKKVGPSDATVFIHGESGTGKELVAEALHEASARSQGPLVKVNCAALVETLLLSELFGHEKGSFTGASSRRRGRFEAAEGGTIFLDEIGDISPRTQVALLRVLQDKMFERVGGVAPIRADVRIVCASHRDLRAMVAAGEFREDLYYRLRGLVLEVPALRDRVGDLPEIATAILARIADERGQARQHLSQRALDGLACHGWPGNVRELENALRAAALFAEGDAIELEDFTNNIDGLSSLMRDREASSSHRPASGSSYPSVHDPAAHGPLTTRSGSVPPLGTIDAYGTFGMLPPSIPAPAPAAADPAHNPTQVAYDHIRAGVSLSDMKRQIERECISRALGESDGNITRAATLLGMKRPRLSQLVKQYGFADDGKASSNPGEES